MPASRIQKQSEFGLGRYWTDRATRRIILIRSLEGDTDADGLSKRVEESLRKMQEEKENKRLSMDHVQGIFYLYIGGVASASVAFGIEIMLHAIKTTSKGTWMYAGDQG